MSTPKPAVYPGDLRAIGAVLALAGLIVTALLISIFGASIMKRILLVAACASALAVSACASAGTLAGAQTALAAANLSLEAYCQLAPEARAEIRRKLGIKVQIIPCPTDVPGTPATIPK